MFAVVTEDEVSFWLCVQWLTNLFYSSSLHLLQNGQHGVILGKEINIFLYIGPFNYRWISSASSTFFIPGMVLLYRAYNLFHVSVNEMQKKKLKFISTPSACFHALILRQHENFTLLKV